MKYIQDTVANRSGGKVARYMIVLGKEEVDVLYSLLEKARRYTPRTMESMSVVSRINTMLSCVTKLRKLIRVTPQEKELSPEPTQGVLPF